MVPGERICFFYDQQGYRGLSQRGDSGYALPHCRCIRRVDREIRTFQSSSFTARGRTTTHDGHAQERRRQWVRPLEEPVLPVQANESTSSGSSQLVDGIPTLPEAQEGATELEMPRTNVARPRRCQVKTKPAPGGGGGGGGGSPLFLSRMARGSRLR